MWLMLAGLAGVCGGGCRGEDLTAPYTFTWSNAPAGTFNLAA